MRLRTFRPDDLQTLYEIDQACFVPGISYTRKELAAFIEHGRAQTWIAEDTDRIVGFLIAHTEPRKTLHIVTIDVLKPFRRQKVGSLLMDAAEDWARDHGLQMIGLETAQDNLEAQKFYASRGYQKAGEVPRYYADGTTAWVMVKQLE
jgi:[ribosomal protein S18]-alanine N-acetyltransferase